MTRPTRPGTPQAMFRRICDRLGGLQNAAEDAGVSIATVSYGLELNPARPGGLGLNHLDRLCRMHADAAEVAAAHFAALGGGVYLPAPRGGPVVAGLGDFMAEAADVMRTHGEALSERSDDPTGYTPAEAAQMAKELQDCARVSARLAAEFLALAEGRE